MSEPSAPDALWNLPDPGPGGTYSEVAQRRLTFAHKDNLATAMRYAADWLDKEASDPAYEEVYVAAVSVDVEEVTVVISLEEV